MWFLAVNFHYIREPSFPFDGIYPVTAAAFERQLDELGKAFTFVWLADLKAHLDGGPSLPERSCLITFDDGLMEQFTAAWPILQHKGIPAAFFVNTKPTLDRTVLTVHKIQWLRAHVSPLDFRRELEARCLARGFAIADATLPPDDVLALQYRYDEPEVRTVKYLLNFIIPRTMVDAVITALFNDRIGDESTFASQLYMGPAEWRMLANNGCLGTHSHAHLALAQHDDVVEDLRSSVEHIFTHTNVTVDAVSYPFGGPGAVSFEVEEAAQSLGLRVGFTMERAFNRSLERPLLLARADTNDVLGGKTPQLMFAGGEFAATGTFGMLRRQYAEECV